MQLNIFFFSFVDSCMYINNKKRLRIVKLKFNFKIQNISAFFRSIYI